MVRKLIYRAADYLVALIVVSALAGLLTLPQWLGPLDRCCTAACQRIWPPPQPGPPGKGPRPYDPAFDLPGPGQRVPAAELREIRPKE